MRGRDFFWFAVIGLWAAVVVSGFIVAYRYEIGCACRDHASAR